MSNNDNKEDEELHNQEMREVTKLVEHMNNLPELRRQMIEAGITKDITHDWVCLRHHTHHPWGITPCLVNGVKSFAFGYRIDEKTVKVVGVFTVPDMHIIDEFGEAMNQDRTIFHDFNAPVPEKKH